VTRDPYEIIGIPRSASEAEIKKAYRRRAKELHPDRNINDPKAQERFSELNSAYEIIGDAAKRPQFDRGEIDADGKPRFKGFEGFSSGGGRSQPFGRGGSPGFDASDIFGEMFGDAMRRGQAAPSQGPGRGRAGPPKGDDVTASLTITLAESAEGSTRQVRLPTGREVEISIPKGVIDGKVMRLRGLGQPSPFGGESGDVLLTVRIKADERFTVDGKDLSVRVRVPLATAVLGGPMRVPTLTGEVEMHLPAMTSSGKSFRLRAKGLPGNGGTGDLYAVIDIDLPGDDAELAELMRRRETQN
jgi:DnaJ-class molecular chaperone